MKASVKEIKGTGFYYVEIKHANQSFRIRNVYDDRKEALWMARMFNKALKFHDQELDEKAMKDKKR